MSILVNAESRVLVQGLTGRQASFHAERSLNAGTRLVGGVVPGKGGQQHLGLPIFDTVQEAMRITKANTSVVFVPPAFAAAAMIEAIEAGIGLLICITERIPVLDMIRVREVLDGEATQLIGPNCPGIVSPGQCHLGIMPREIFQPGRIGIVSRASTLTYDAVAEISRAGLGQSTCVGIGADAVQGLGFTDICDAFAEDPETDGIVLIGEIGGSAEERLADAMMSRPYRKPLVACIAGRHAPSGQRMGHAGAIQERGRGSAASKLGALAAAGASLADSPGDIARLMNAALAQAAGVSLSQPNPL